MPLDRLLPRRSEGARVRGGRGPADHGRHGTEVPHRSWKLRVRSLLVLVLLVPTVGMVGVATTSAANAVATRDAARRVRDKADLLTGVVDAHLAITAEETQAVILWLAAEAGLDSTDLSTILGVDHRAAVAAARAAVDDDVLLRSSPMLAGGVSRLRSLRVELDAGTASFEELGDAFAGLLSSLDDVWRVRQRGLQDELSSEELAGSLHVLADAVQTSFYALSWGSVRARLGIELLQAPDTEVFLELLDAHSRYGAATDEEALQLGPTASVAWARLESDPAVRRFEGLIDLFAVGVLSGETYAAIPDARELGAVAVDGAVWASALSDVVRATAADLREEAAIQARSATDAVRTQIAIAAVFLGLALTSALLLARSVTRPIRRLEEAAKQVHRGHFDLPPMATTGPRELADTASAFNEMATTLATVESHAVALADDPDAPFLDEQIPGRTGRALQVAMNRLRASIRAADQHRRQLQQAATHDGLTGLLNRGAALAMIERDFATATRSDAVVMAMFVDLDRFKSVNDRYGHATGDDALRLTAHALRSATRDADVVARLGGDEFLVAGVVDDRSEVERMATRIRDALAAHDLNGPDGPIPLRCSIGMALSGPGTTTVDALIGRADAALYIAKGRGRDQIAWDEPPDPGDTPPPPQPRRDARHPHPWSVPAVVGPADGAGPTHAPGRQDTS